MKSCYLLLLTLACCAALCVNGCSSNSGASATVTTTGGVTAATAPVVTAVAPSTIDVSAPATLTVTGSNFTTASTVQVNGLALSTTFVSSTQLTVAVAAGQLSTGTSISVVVTDHGVSSAASGPTVTVANPVPALTILAPAAVDAGSTDTQIVLTGSGFTSATAVLVNGTAAAASVVSPTQIKVTFKAADLALPAEYSVTVSNPAPGGGTSGPVQFMVVNPAPGSISLLPATVTVGTATSTVAVAGTRFIASSVVAVNGSARPTTYVSSTSLTFQLLPPDTASRGSLSVTVTTPPPGGGVSPTATLPVTNATPMVTAFSPSTLSPGGQTPATFTLTGTGFAPGSTVTVNGSPHAATVVSVTQLTFALSVAEQANAGTLSIVVSAPLPGGGSSTAILLTISARQPLKLASVNPLSAVLGTPFTLHVLGSGFVGDSVVLWNGFALPTHLVSGSELSASVNAALLSVIGSVNVTVGSTAANVVVSNAASIPIVNPVPQIASVTPSVISHLQSSTISVSGSGFVGASTVVLNGTAIPTTYLDGNTLGATVTAAMLPSGTSTTLAVTTPAPGGGTTATLPLQLSNLPEPVITSASVYTRAGTNCGQTSLLLVGTDFTTQPIVRVNGTVITQNPYTYGQPTFASVVLPNGTSIAPGSSITVQDPSPGGLTSTPFVLPASTTPVLALCAVPAQPTVYAGGLFALDLSTVVVNAAGKPVLSAVQLPSGFSMASGLPLSLSSGSSSRVLIRVASGTATGVVTLPVTVTVGAVTSTVNLPITVATGSGTVGFASGLYHQLAVPIGGSAQIAVYTLYGNGSADVAASLGATGLPAGVTATFDPAFAIPNETVTVTLTAAASAVPQQNVQFQVTASSEGGATSSVNLLVSVFKGPGTISNNRSAFVSTDARPVMGVYDAAHDLVFVANYDWNRVDVISNATHQLLRSIPVPGPTAVDLLPDSTTLWVGTASQQLFAVDTTTFLTRRYTLPDFVVTYSNRPQTEHWSAGGVFALSDGTVLVNTSGWDGAGPGQLVFSPASGAVTTYNTFTQTPYNFKKSTDGTKVFSLQIPVAGSSICALHVYSTAQAAFTDYSLNGTVAGTSYCGSLEAVNGNGSLVVQNANTTAGNQMLLLSGTGQVQRTLTPSLATPTVVATSPTSTFVTGSLVFSADSTTLYQIADGPALLATFDVASGSLVGTAPTMGNSFSQVFGVDRTGMMMGLQTSGVAFEDSTYLQSYTNAPSGEASPYDFYPQSGPPSGGTTVGVYGAVDMQPDSWFGDVRGTSTFSGNTVSLISPPASTPGPVDLKLIYPNGVETFQPAGFSYGPAPQQALYSGSSPQGGGAGVVTGFGLPQDSSSGSVSVGGSPAAITSVIGQYPAFTGAGLPSTYLKFTLPPGTPGYADIAVQTPSGAGTLPKAVFYAKSVNSYAVNGTARAVLYDKVRKQAYVATSTGLMVFSTTSGQWIPPLQVPTLNGTMDLRDLALSVDGTHLVVTNASDGSVAVLDPTGSSAGYAIAVPGLVRTIGTCSIGPGAVAALAGNKALVFPQMATGNNCGYLSKYATIDLQARTAVTSAPSALFCDNTFYNPQVQSSGDGTLAFYLSSNGASCTYPGGISSSGYLDFLSTSYSGAVSADGNIMASDTTVVDSNLHRQGKLAQPMLLYGVSLGATYPADPATATLRNARLNDAGSLYYMPHAGYFEIMDVPTATLRMRFSLKEVVQDVNEPISIDSGGRQVFLLTDAGLTVVDLGEAPLSVGHVSLAGQTLTIRGSGFAQGMSARLDGTSSVAITVVDENTATITLPALTVGGHDLTLTRIDGTVFTDHGAITTQ